MMDINQFSVNLNNFLAENLGNAGGSVFANLEEKVFLAGSYEPKIHQFVFLRPSPTVVIIHTLVLGELKDQVESFKVDRINLVQFGSDAPTVKDSEHIFTQLKNCDLCLSSERIAELVRALTSVQP